MIIRDFEKELQKRLDEKFPFIQVIVGPRQVGKTTGALRIFDTWAGPKHFVSADDPTPKSSEWLLAQWKIARQQGPGTLFVVDEIQKVRGWGEVSKKLFDQDRQANDLRVVLLGSASLSVQQGLSSSLAGRFELVRADHWSYAESQAAFGWTLEQYLAFGGYPAAAVLIGDVNRWRSFILDSIIEPVLGRDLAGLVAIAKPALFRQTFELAMQFPGQVVSYTKLLGQLQEGGNSTTIRHYLELLAGAFLLKLLPLYSGGALRRRTASPKLLPLAPTLSQVYRPQSIAASDTTWRGRILESVVGAHLSRLPGNLYYWADGDYEVDFVREVDGRLIAYEVKSERSRRAVSLEKFLRLFPGAEVQVIESLEQVGAFLLS